MLTHRQQVVFAISTLCIGIVVGLFIARVTASDSRVSSQLNFATQSVGASL